ncbi:hypothetical protein A3H53_01285 [Candidatus Nomurabacteria bacterium RIFCSPLOWO2_02_FULL_40_10]|uniref:DUF5698 domain-containing protein n=1 Tax=Candidatus Nomurabacteria bacterium RIFCSPLOWO2_02_FULL_40_10 TaxID=1801786 RepID=A0A1F6XWY6_9BACT|nr:MAG: hypothetical protein A3H53_01285 [Candidatus Nomurabacteria bacterium RIFCSPLOWO2_02_FULL_40_10]
MDYYLLIYFFAGVLQDFVFTLNLRFVNKDRILPAVLTSFLITVISLLVLYNILTNLDSQRSILAIIIYAAGIATGTYFAMKFKVAHKEEK